MIQANDNNIRELKLTARMIVQESMARGWKVWLYLPGASHLRIEREDGKQLELYASTAPTLSYIAARRADDKYFTYKLLLENDFPVLETFIADSQDTSRALELVNQLLTRGKRCVIKPLDAAHGDGVTVNIADTETARQAVNSAASYASSLIIQEYRQDALDLRITCIDHKVASVLYRTPARVRGDGIHTLRQLIDIENAKQERGTGYEKGLSKIDEVAAERFLAAKIGEVPARDEWVNVMGVANVGAGGEIIEVTHPIPQWLQEMAEDVSRLAQLPVCAVDFLIQNEVIPKSTIQDLQPVIIELNKAPGLLYSAVKKYLNYLATL